MTQSLQVKQDVLLVRRPSCILTTWCKVEPVNDSLYRAPISQPAEGFLCIMNRDGKSSRRRNYPTVYSNLWEDEGFPPYSDMEAWNCPDSHSPVARVQSLCFQRVLMTKPHPHVHTKPVCCPWHPQDASNLPVTLGMDSLLKVAVRINMTFLYTSCSHWQLLKTNEGVLLAGFPLVQFLPRISLLWSLCSCNCSLGSHGFTVRIMAENKKRAAPSLSGWAICSSVSTRHL